MFAQLMQFFGHLDADTKARLTDLINEAMRAPDAGSFIRGKVAKMFVKESWHLEMLGVPRGASQEAINKAYRQTLVHLHPDKLKGEDRLMKLLDKARDMALRGE